ncbi:recombinase family protein [Streptomyces sp. NL15-2K]|uniref:recombinase family protein n=1 Tax=Streptomyces sp. NL15-2K TaxID=376149 RepID=UPI000F560FA2|nr:MULTISPECIES: recombinase family protein [Actinomycetes]WKX09964.1 recombinase family protein [Kutzneria buriramensis]
MTVTDAIKIGISYLRVSTKEQAEKGGQAEGFSIPAQREANRRKAESIGVVIVAEFIDAGESAKSADRPDLQRMLRYLAENPVDYVFVHKVDRLARNRVDDVEITLAIKKAGATLVSATENIDETPSGMLLHGIMSSIAEFYSRNLATEVHKGMSQKAKTGGTPGKAPLGYLNVVLRTLEGREERTVEVDPERAELISWAFEAFASGTWTLRSLADELETRGLTTKRTPKMPSRPIRPNVLHSILTNPYYRGEVVYQGVIYPGRHTPLTNLVTWQKVQDVLAANLVGERQRDHPHYLKSSVFCGDCGSRLIITNAKNRHGVVYPYFVCLGRHQKTTSCTRKALLITKIEKMVEDHWSTVRLAPELRDAIEEGLRSELATHRKEAEDEHKQLVAEKAKLTAQRQKLLEAIYSGAVPMDLIASEQQRITDQLTAIEARLGAATATFDAIEANLTRALDLARDCHAAYLASDPQLRRLFNQAFFTHLMIDEDGVHSEYAEPFDTLLDGDVLDAGRAALADRAEGQAKLREVLERPASSANKKTPSTLAGGLSVHLSTPVRGVEGSNTTTLVPPAGFEPATPALRSFLGAGL